MTTETTGTTTSGRGINDPYFQWLCKSVDIPRNRPYLKLALELHNHLFKPGDAVETDNNRALDGLRLRVIFMDRYGPQGSSSNRGACTMLEFLIGLAKRMDYIMGAADNNLNVSHYFWKMIENLRLSKLDDDRFYELNGEFFVQEAVDRVLFRTYEKNGNGGLFPLKRPMQDQREIEIWYQMQNWLLESGDFEAE